MRSFADRCFVHLEVGQRELERRLAAREGHLMPSSLFGSQLATLQLLQGYEGGVTIANHGDLALTDQQSVDVIERNYASEWC